MDKVAGKKRWGYLDVVMTLAGKPPKAERAYPGSVISFTDEDFPSEPIKLHEGALVITTQVGSVDMKRMMIDNGSSVDFLYAHAYHRMPLDGRKIEIGQEAPLYGFSNDQVNVAGTIELPVVFGTAPQQVQIMCKFYVVHVNSAYNAILGRPTLTTLQAVTSIPHFKIKFSTPHGVGEVAGDLDLARRCYRNALINSGVGVSKQKLTMTIEIEPFTESGTETLVMPAEETEEFELMPGKKEKMVKIGSGLSEPFRTNLIELIRCCADIFAWASSDMPGVSRKIAKQRLQVDPSKKHVQQKRRIFVPERQKIIDEEVVKLLVADFIFEIDYPE